MTSLPVFPNYTQMRQPLSLRAWQALRLVSVISALALVLVLLIQPDAGLWLMWGLAVPLLPALFLLAPGLWRNVCPIATLNQTPRVFGFTRGLTLPRWLREYGYVIGIAFFVAAVSSRKVVFNENGPALAALSAAVLGAAFVGGLLFKGKSGWCSSGVCPLFAVQRVYGQTPFAVIPNSHCQPCVGCAKNCYDFNPAVAYLADLADEDRRYRGYRTFFVGGFPGLIAGFYTIPTPPAISEAEMYARFALYIAAGVGLFALLDTFFKVSTAKVTALFGAAALNLYYWYTFPIFLENFTEQLEVERPDALIWAFRAAVFVVTAVWLVRTYRKEQLFLIQTAAARQPRLSLAGSIVARRRAGLGRPEVTFMPEQRRVVVQPDRSILEIAEKNDLKIEAGCRMGVCGADPVAILGGMENCSPIGDDERNTLERLGLAKNTRMACVCLVRGDVSVSLKPERPREFSSSVVRGASRDPAVSRVVIIGNGIAGVTAADHVRRRHPMAEIHVVAKERHHLYNRMAIERLIYGRSAMQGLYLQAEQWYDDLKITTWLNTRATRIDRVAKEVVLGTGEKLAYDRLVLAMGSSAMVPPIDGFGMAGTFVLREADDAFAIRAYAQEHGCRHAVVAGGGLLGLEAAHALHKLGLHVAVLERSGSLLRRQLDERGGQLLREYLEGLGLEVVTSADTASVDGEGRVRRVSLKDGRALPCDLFLVAAGITPNVGLARAAGLEVKRGVLVDDYLRTSDPAIYAAGDIAEHRGQVYGLWPTAAEQAQVAAVNAVALPEARTVYEGSVPVTMLKVVGVDLTSVGQFEPQSPDDIVIALEDEAEHRYRKLVIADGVIAGAILFGYPLLSPIVTAAIKRHADVAASLDALRAGNWDALGALPEGAPRRGPVAAAPAPARPPAPPAPGPAAVPLPEAALAARAAMPPQPTGAPGPSAPAPSDQPATAPPLPAAPVTTARVRLLLNAMEGPAADWRWELGEKSGTLGRDEANAIHIPDRALSRRHAAITYEDGIYWIADLDSTNGVFVNDARLQAPHPLRTGDRIRLGATLLVASLERRDEG